MVSVQADRQGEGKLGKHQESTEPSLPDGKLSLGYHQYGNKICLYVFSLSGMYTFVGYIQWQFASKGLKTVMSSSKLRITGIYTMKYLYQTKYDSF